MELSNHIDWKQLDAEAKLSNWTLTDNIYINHSIQKYFDCCDSKKKRGKMVSTVSDILPKVQVPKPHVPFLRVSDLSIEDQRFSLDTYKDYVCGKEIAPEKLNQLQDLMRKLSSEQEEFLRFLQQNSVSKKDEYNFLHAQVKTEIQNTIETLRCEVTKNLPPFYTLFQTVGLSSGAVLPNDPILSYKQTLKQAVGQCLLTLPDMNTIMHKSLLEKNITETSVHPPQINEDPVACDLARDNNVHFVLTAEALQTLIDNHQPDYDKDWELPVTVIDQSKDACEKTSESSKIIMIDEPLPPKSVKPREANIMFYRSKVCEILGKPQKSQDVINFANSAVEENKEEQEKMAFENMESDVENFNIDMTPQTGNKKEQMFISDTKLRSEAASQWTYGLWTFGNLNLLIRTSDCGFLYQANKTGKGSLHPVNVFVKPEYQLAYGYEQITISEASRWWINTYVNPDSLCICARINPVTGQLLKLDVLNQSNVLTLSSFNPAKQMKMIHGALTRLVKILRPGKYILSHSSKDMHMCVYEAMGGEKGGKTKKVSYELHNAHSKEILVEYEKYLPWVPVDPNIFLDWHIAHHRMPLTFPPVTKEELIKIQKKNVKFVNKKTKKGKKGKYSKTGSTQKKDNVVNVETKAGKTFDKSIQSDKQEENEDEIGIAQRLRSKAKPVTYDDIDFDF